MKITISSMILMVASLLFFSCNSTKEKTNENLSPGVEEKETPFLDSTYMISKDTFDVWKKRWDTNFRSYFRTDSLHYFTMPLIDMQAIIGESATNSRMYMGMSIDGSGELEPHVMLVGVNNGTVNWSRIMDYTNSCPPICGN